MMVSRRDTSVVARWWWSVDRWLLAAVALLFAIGGILSLAASPAAAGRIGLPSFHFVIRHGLYLVPAVGVMLAVSLLPLAMVRHLALAVFAVALVLVGATLLGGASVKGAQRWLHLGGLSLQPSEFVRPAFVVVAAWLFAAWRKDDDARFAIVSAALCGLTSLMLILQPDVGMALTVLAVWVAQFFLAGLPMALVGAAGVFGFAALAGAYLFLPHVASRIDRFLSPAGHDNYQIERSLEAFAAGGLFGRGPGEGEVKRLLPDGHTDFVFAVAGEEFGLWFCLVILGLFALVVLRGLTRLLAETNPFVLYAAGGLLILFGLQAALNIGVNLHLLPTKGMTLPFVSYGGSSLVALAFGMGMLLALTRQRSDHGVEA
jgi:cell division protein FtsW